MTATTEIELSEAARRLIEHCKDTGHFVADSRAAVICQINIRNLVQALEPAVESGELRRVRDPSGVMGYRSRVDETLQRIATATPRTDAQPKPPEIAPTARRTNPRRLPVLDISTLPITMEPHIDGRATSKRRTWDALLDTLAAEPIRDGKYPTRRLPPEYGGALQSAAAAWTKARKDGKKIRVARLADAAVVQRAA